MENYKPEEFWERSHAAVSAAEVNHGFGVRHVGGGQSAVESAALYRLRRINMLRLLKRSALPANPRIFELGSGGGYWVQFFDKFHPKTFVGADVSETATERLASAYPLYHFVTLGSSGTHWSKIERLGPYDLSLAIDVLYHITDDTLWHRVLTHLCRVTERGGLLIVVDYFYPRPTDRPSRVHVKFRNIQQYLNLLEHEGFCTEDIQPIFYWLNRTVGGPWRDDNRIKAKILRISTSGRFGLNLLAVIDRMMTKIARPMDPACTARFLLARKVEAVGDENHEIT